jgi:predicted HAD superfamily Cof-like phosphohydrolase
MQQLSHFELVGEFHDVFGHPQRKELYYNVYNENSELVSFRIDLIEEEYKELLEATNNKDTIEIADALCDMLYVINGAGQCLGIKMENVSSNIDVEGYLIRMKMLIIGLRNSTTICVLGDMLKELLQLVYNTGYTLGFDMDVLFREVHRSNMTKVCDNIDDVILSVEQYKKEGRYKKPSFRQKGKYYVIYDEETTKILKNHKWTKPNLSNLINQ